jgi:hypothetical protein
MRSIPKLTSLVIGLATVALAAGCPNREVSKVDPSQVKEGYKDIPVEINRDIDILFVIDNSGSMAEEQASLSNNFNRFISVLQNIEGGLPNIHLGVISTDVGAGPFNISGCSGNGDNGQLQSAPNGSCTPPSGAFISDIDDGVGGRIKNYTEDLAVTFSCIARLGIDGCGFEQPFESLKRALNGSNPTNAEFLRPSAFLAVILITDEDDCSTSDTNMFDTAQNSVSDPLGPLSSFRCFEFGVRCDPDTPRTPGPRQDCEPRNDSSYMYGVDEYVTFLKGLKEDPNMVIVGGIIGNPTPVTVGVDDDNNPELDPSCVSASGDADPGVRLSFFLEAFPQRSTVTTICNEDLSDALILIAELLAKVIGNPCIEGNIDADPDVEGVQYECQVSDVRYPGEDRQEETIIPECNLPVTEPASPLPCWHFVPDVGACPDTPTNLTLLVERGSGSVPTGTHVVARCVIQ